MAKTRTNEEWLELVRQQRASGLTLKGWCEDNGVNLHTMADRIGRLREMGLLKEPKPCRGRYSEQRTTAELRKYEQFQTMQWVEVSDEPPPAAPAEIRVEIGKFKIVVLTEFPEAAFLRVCKALTSLC